MSLFIVACVLLVASVAASSTPKRFATKYKWELDNQKMTKENSKLIGFTIQPEALIRRCKDVIDKDIGIGRPDDLADDFYFQFPYIGPLYKDEYLETVGGFKLTQPFPDFNPGFHNFCVDPVEPNRVWFYSRFTATHTGESPFGKPTGVSIEAPPQVISLTFNNKGQVSEFSVLAMMTLASLFTGL